MKLKSLFSLEKKIVLITGGAGYLGTSMSEALAEAGAIVIIASRSEKRCKALAEKLDKLYNTNCRGFLLDVTSQDCIKKVVESIIQEFGRIDILVNNASFSDPAKIEDMSCEQWINGMEGTINSVFRVSHVVIPRMITQRQGNIINISSMYGVVSPDPRIYGTSTFSNPANYSIGKAAILHFTRYYAVHLAPYGIRVNAISPGPFPHRKIQSEKWFMQNLSNKVPLGRIGQPDELKGAIIYLASSASSYVTGHNLVVDGGWTIW